MRASWTSNLILKVVSLLVAVLVWNVYRTEPTSIRVMTVPLQYGAPPQHLELTDEPPDTIRLRVEATEATLRDLMANPVQARIDLSDLSTGQQFIPVTEESFHFPPGVKVLRIEPDLISLHVERKLDLPVRIEPVTTGEVAPGYEMVQVVLTPATVQVEGPESEVRKIEKVRTGSIDLTGKTETFREAVSVVTENSAVRISDERSTVATVEIREIPQERGFVHVPVVVENAAAPAKVDPPTLGVSVKGPPSKLDELDVSNFRIVVDAEGLQPRTRPYTLHPEVRLVPPLLAGLLEVTGTSQDSVRVRLGEE